MNELYNSLPTALKFLVNVFAYGLSFTIMISAIYQIPVKNHKLKRELVDSEKELTRISVQKKKEQDDYIKMMKSHEKEKNELVSQFSGLREEIKVMKQEKQDLFVELEETKKKLGGRPKGSTKK